MKTPRLSLVVLAGGDVSPLQSGTLTVGLTWGTGYTPNHLNLATQTVLDARGLTAGIALVTVRSEVTGHVAFHAQRSDPGVVWISYEMAQPAQNQGYASESVIALSDDLIAAGFTVRAEVQRGNTASKRVLVKAGLKQIRELGFGEIWERPAH